MIKNKYYVLLLIILASISCSEDSDTTIPRNLDDYIITIAGNEVTGNVIACAANADGNSSLTYIFYYPEEGATDIRYYEANSLSDVSTDFSNYRRQNLTTEAVFGGKLARFSRSGADENWCLVTYILDGKLHVSAPIRLKNDTVPTTYATEVVIENASTLMPTFTWSDFGITDNNIYFQVLSDENDDFISGIYTRENFFTYYDVSNTDQNLVINTETPDNLVLNTTYNFTLMGVSSDNWVNLIIQDEFVTE